MRNKLMIAAAASALLLGMVPGAALAQRGGGGGGGGGGAGGVGSRPTTVPTTRLPSGELDRTQDQLRDKDQTGDYDQDRDRLRDKDQTGDQDQDRDQLRDKDQTGDQDQDRDRLQTSRAIDDQLASFSLLTSDERTQFRNEMRAATTPEERDRIRASHQKTIQDRAREMGLSAPAGTGAGMGYRAQSGYMLMTMLTEHERDQFMSRLQSAQTAQERQQIRNEMHTMAQQRARDMGVDMPEWYGRGPGLR